MPFEPEIEDILGAGPTTKKRVNSKAKGNRSELKICKLLTEHFGEPFNRVPSSGAFGTSHQSLQKNARDILAGDVITPKGFLFVIENKVGYNIDLINLYSDKDNTDKKLFFGFLEQASRDAKRTDRLPMVVYTKDRRETLACFPRDFFGHSSELLFDRIFHFQWLSPKFPEWPCWTLVGLSELLGRMPKECFYRVSEVEAIQE
jgi:hypothetical protein